LKKKGKKQKKIMDILPVAVDIGNSRLKIKTTRTFAAFDYKKGWEAEINNLFESFTEERILVCYSSVNPYRLRTFLKIIKDRVPTPYNAKEIASEQQVLNYRHIKGIGIDRVMGMIGALEHFKPPLITVDCGTAVTINAVDKDHNCLGGAILPGIETQIKSLKENAAGLKKIEISPFLKNVKPSHFTIAAGKDTSSAIRAGVVLGVTGTIKEIISRIIKQEFKGEDVQLIITGGAMDLVYEVLKESDLNFHIQRDLVLDGAMFLLKAYINLVISYTMKELIRLSELKKQK
jgi:pantothenate kinase type III